MLSLLKKTNKDTAMGLVGNIMDVNGSPTGQLNARPHSQRGRAKHKLYRLRKCKQLPLGLSKNSYLIYIIHTKTKYKLKMIIFFIKILKVNK